MGCIRKIISGDSPGGLVANNPPCKAGDMGSIPGWGTKTPHASEQLSMCTTRESAPQRDTSRETIYRESAPQRDLA